MHYPTQSTDRNERTFIRGNVAEIRALQAMLRSSQEEVESLRVALSASSQTNKDLKEMNAQQEELVKRLHAQVNRLAARLQAGIKPLALPRKPGHDVATSPLPLPGLGLPALRLAPLARGSPLQRGRTPAHDGTTPQPAHSPIRALPEPPVPEVRGGDVDIPLASTLSVREAVNMCFHPWTHPTSHAQYPPLQGAKIRDIVMKQQSYRVLRAGLVFQELVALKTADTDPLRNSRDPLLLLENFVRAKNNGRSDFLGEKLYSKGSTPQGLAASIWY